MMLWHAGLDNKTQNMIIFKAHRDYNVQRISSMYHSAYRNKLSYSACHITHLESVGKSRSTVPLNRASPTAIT